MYTVLYELITVSSNRIKTLISNGVFFFVYYSHVHVQAVMWVHAYICLKKNTNKSLQDRYKISPPCFNRIFYFETHSHKTFVYFMVVCTENPVNTVENK